MGNLGRGLLGGFGAIQNKVEFVKTDYAVFVRDLAPGSPVLTSAVEPGFFARGIRAVTGMPWDHTLNYVGRSAGQAIRERFPELLAPRFAIFQGKSCQLKAIPPEAVLHEIVESGPTVEINSLDKYNTDKTCLEAWSRPYTQQQLESFLFNLYLMVGMPYDVGEIGAHVGILPNTTENNSLIQIQTNAGLYAVSIRVCSSLTTHALDEVEKIPNGEQISPGGLHKYFMKTPIWSRRLFNTRPGK